MRATASICLIFVAACAHTPPHDTAWIDGVDVHPHGRHEPRRVLRHARWRHQRRRALYDPRPHHRRAARSSPHTHPDPRVITVVDGELCYGFGAVFDAAACKMYPEGSYFLVPANAPHYGFGKNGDAVYQESGVGPSAFIPVTASR